jgi:hypothetical protein
MENAEEVVASPPLKASAAIDLQQINPLSREFAEKSVQAAIAAIEIYNKPDFRFREEAFSLLMTNAWELLIKAKWLSDHKEDVASLYVFDLDPLDHSKKLPRLNRCNNPITSGVTSLAQKLFEDSNSGLEKPCLDNLLALVEVRDTSAHFLNKDLYFGRRILEIGTASVQNFVGLVTEWFQIDLTRYNFFLMPLSFYHGFETAAAISISSYPEQVRRLIEYLDFLNDSQKEVSGQHQRQHFSLCLETQLVKSKGASGTEFRWTDDPNAPAVALREEDFRKNFPWTYRVLTENLKKRYADFLENNSYHNVRKPLENDKKLVTMRLLNPNNPKSSKQRFYNPNIVQHFDKHYSRRSKN